MAQFIALLFFLLLAGKALLQEQRPSVLPQMTENTEFTTGTGLLLIPIGTMQRLYF